MGSAWDDPIVGALTDATESLQGALAVPPEEVVKAAVLPVELYVHVVMRAHWMKTPELRRHHLRYRFDDRVVPPAVAAGRNGGVHRRA